MLSIIGLCSKEHNNDLLSGRSFGDGIFSVCTSLEFSSLTVPQLPEAHSDPQRPSSHLHPAGLLWTSGQLPDQPSGLRGESQKRRGSLQVIGGKGEVSLDVLLDVFIRYVPHESQKINCKPALRKKNKKTAC